MKKINTYLFIVAFMLGFSKTYSQENKSVTYLNYTKAKQVFDKLLQKNKYDSIDTLHYSLLGIWQYLGHYNLPEKREKSKVNEKIFMQGGNNLKLKGVVELSGNEYNKEVYYYDSLSLRNYGETNTITNFIDIRKQDDLILLSPITLINDIEKNINTLRYIGYSKEHTCDVLTYSSFLGKQITLYVRDDSIILRAERLDYDNINGDYLTEYLYQNYTSVKSFLLPSKITIKEWGTQKKTLNYEYTKVTKKHFFCSQYNLEKIDNRLYTITLPDNQNRVFVIDFGAYLGIIEAPVSSEYSACIYKALQTEFPKKEIKYLFLTHHHPDHAGGFDYFFKRGVSIVTTKINKEYFKKLSIRSHTIKNDFLSSYKERGVFKIISTNGVKKIKAKNQSIFIYEIGQTSLHTDEYLLYYLPQQKSLIIGDLWRVPKKGVYGSQRASNIYSLIQKEGIDVKYIYQTWPLQNAKKVADIEELKQSVLLNHKK